MASLITDGKSKMVSMVTFLPQSIKYRVNKYYEKECFISLTLNVVNTTQPWETTRGIGFSFGYNRNEGEKETMSSVDIVKMLIDIVSKGGNLLLDVGPLPNGSISAIQERRLRV